MQVFVGVLRAQRNVKRDTALKTGLCPAVGPALTPAAAAAAPMYTILRPLGIVYICNGYCDNVKNRTMNHSGRQALSSRCMSTGGDQENRDPGRIRASIGAATIVARAAARQDTTSHSDLQ